MESRPGRRARGIGGWAAALAAFAALGLAALGCEKKPPPFAQLGEACHPVTRRCDAGLYCQAYDMGTPQPAVCAAVPAGGCAEEQRPTCGTDGKVYGGRCSVLAAGADVGYDGGCALDAEHFACGQLVCGRGTYCFKEGACFGPPQRECRPLPGKCKTSPTCECLGETNCRPQADGSLLVWVPSG